MKTVKGIYENGQIRFLETPPVKSRNKVLVTFLEDDDEDIVRGISFDHSNAEFKNYLEDSGEDLYQEYLNRKNDDR